MQNVQKDLEIGSHPSLRVIKLGGSLLTQAHLPKLFEAWIADQPRGFNLIVVGGGEMVEAIRELDQIHSLDSSFVHWLCVDLMHETAALAQRILNIDNFCQKPDELSKWNDAWKYSDLGVHFSTSTAIVSPKAFYTCDLARVQNCPLKESWETTSDSIAAWLAQQLDAYELILLKSSNPLLGDNGLQLQSPSSDDLISIATSGLVDIGFPNIAAGLPLVRIECLSQFPD